jgi:molybdenum cofactor synthesis domain-containing protein
MKYTAGILVLSDSCSKGERKDISGLLIKKILESVTARDGGAQFEIKDYSVISDDREDIEDRLFFMADALRLNLVLTTGGTGFSPRDNTPEATKAVIHRETPGISEAVRMNSMKYTDRAMLSRAVSGIRHNTLIINLPGSPKAVAESLEFIMGAIIHGLDILLKYTSDCARKPQWE